LPKVKIPDDLLEYFRDEEQGIDKISDFLKLHPELMPVFIIQPKTTTYPTHIFQGGKAVYEVIAATAGTVTTSISPSVIASEEINFPIDPVGPSINNFIISIPQLN